MYDNNEITAYEYKKIVDIVYKFSSIILSNDKIAQVKNRLSSRLKELNMNFQQYIQVLESNNSLEIEYLINHITTNETYFFREDKHFELIKDYLIENKGLVFFVTFGKISDRIL